MSKKMILGIIILVLAAAWAIAKLNLFPTYTGLMNSGYATLMGWFGINPIEKGATIASFAGGLAGVVKIMHDRAANSLSALQETANNINSRLSDDNQVLQGKYSQLGLEYQDLQGQLTAKQSELDTMKQSFSNISTQLQTANTQLQQKTNELVAVTRVKAEELHMSKGAVSIQEIIRAGSTATPAQIKAAITEQGLKATVE